MATTSTNLGLTIPESTDQPNITPIATNFSKIDNAFTNVARTYEDYTFNNVGYTAGTPGTRGNQYIYTPTKEPIYAIISDISNSANVLPIVFIYNSKVYLNVHRALTTAVSDITIKVRVFYRN